jgi:Flp pilus assembly pilin Flp
LRRAIAGLVRRLVEDGGHELMTYLVVLALIALAATSGITGMMTRLNTIYSNISVSMSQEMNQ